MAHIVGKNVTWGYEHIGQFQSYDEIYNSPIQDGKGKFIVTSR